MARTARKKCESGVYHVMLRGINKQVVFFDDDDRKVFLNRLKFAKEKHPYELFAFCLMDNHIHLLVKEMDTPIGKIFQNALSSFVFWYNRKYERIGNLFQDRFKSEPIETNAKLLSATRYIHQNPVKAGLVKNVADYQWSSFNAYLEKTSKLVDTEFVLSNFQNEQQFVEFSNASETTEFLEPTTSHGITDEKLLQKICLILGQTRICDLSSLDQQSLKKHLADILKIEGTNASQISRVTGISMWTIRTLLK